MTETAVAALPFLPGDLRQPRRLGALLVDRGEATPDAVGAALAAQPETRARIGAILSARGWAGERAVAAAAAEQSGLDLADLQAAPIDPDLGDLRDLPVYLRSGFAPWRREDATIAWVATDIDAAAAGLSALKTPPERARLALVDRGGFEAAMLGAYAEPAARRAATRTPRELSARRRMSAPAKAAIAAACLASAAAFSAAPGLVAGYAFLLLAMLNAGNGALRIAALGTALARERPAPAAAEADVAPIADRRPPPRATLLVPLVDEPEVAPVLVQALERIDYPPELLDVKLILEQGDEVTRAALDACAPPPFCRVLTVPKGGPRTKPRAMNVALDLAEGDIVGIYDAEDQPEPDQLRKAAAALAAAPPEVACVQAKLSYFNASENWLTRCFTLEYALWFDVLLRGFERLGLPLPLGGTSVFFRRSALEALGGWDAHNVTEDADLGMRLARAGYRCEVFDSTTYEEANSRLLPWIKQRSRWLKGYAQTWITHMRRPARLWRDLGWRGFLGFHAILLGGMVAYFGLPIFWAMWVAALAGVGPTLLTDLSASALVALGVLHLASWLATFTAAVIATRRRRKTGLLWWTPTLFLYWPLGAAAAYLALIELAVAPFYWRKTRHGVGRHAAAVRRAALHEAEERARRAA